MLMPSWGLLGPECSFLWPSWVREPPQANNAWFFSIKVHLGRTTPARDAPQGQSDLFFTLFFCRLGEGSAARRSANTPINGQESGCEHTRTHARVCSGCSVRINDIQTNSQRAYCVNDFHLAFVCTRAHAACLYELLCFGFHVHLCLRCSATCLQLALRASLNSIFLQAWGGFGSSALLRKEEFFSHSHQI